MSKELTTKDLSPSLKREVVREFVQNAIERHGRSGYYVSLCDVDLSGEILTSKREHVCHLDFHYDLSLDYFKSYEQTVEEKERAEYERLKAKFEPEYITLTKENAEKYIGRRFEISGLSKNDWYRNRIDYLGENKDFTIINVSSMEGDIETNKTDIEEDPIAFLYGIKVKILSNAAD